MLLVPAAVLHIGAQCFYSIRSEIYMFMLLCLFRFQVCIVNGAAIVCFIHMNVWVVGLGLVSCC